MTGNRDPESAGDHSGHYRSSFAAVNSKTADTRIGDYFKLVRVHHANVVSEEVPGTLSSLKLSSMELNDLTQKLGRKKAVSVRDPILRTQHHNTSNIVDVHKDVVSGIKLG
ncbi:hypothetical protein Ahy_B03g065150 [Arachis hypogaea]|uniref:Uncharacterized protein n=1 Tax=Arachis hypogaea TaxID=3818 RepID=A0A445A0W0_ARAHY|nr:hypothetical protein Ahy_B03g065150 [Arachis hypogaea]